MTREALVCLLLLAAVGWTVANDPGIPEARPVAVDATMTPDWEATAHWAQSWADTYYDGLLRCLYARATDYAVATRHPCARGDELYLPVVTR
jgi:hypothetical protein